MPTKVVIMGLGPIGAGVARQLLSRRNFKIVAAVDIDPAKAGKDLADVLGLAKKTGVKVMADAAAAIRKAKPQVAVLCTSSSLKRVWPQLEAVLKLKVPIVSTTEELSYPWFSNRALARDRRRGEEGEGRGGRHRRQPRLRDGRAADHAHGDLRARGLAACRRIQDARIRRLPFQQKIGSGLTPEQFADKVKDLSVRHVGLTESVAMLADALGWKLDRVTDEIQPKIAQAPVESQFLKVAAGRVCGIVQDGVGYVSGEPRIVLHMEAYLGAPETYDRVGSRARRGSTSRPTAATTATWRPRRSRSTPSRGCSRRRPGCTRCAASRCRPSPGSRRRDAAARLPEGDGRGFARLERRGLRTRGGRDSRPPPPPRSGRGASSRATAWAWWRPRPPTSARSTSRSPRTWRARSGSSPASAPTCATATATWPAATRIAPPT